ncbi:hypothetical protein LIER_18969 [Lithospermum erythrorhizon]|uniref:Uncharacterized protein n=1 Tax=Lithospermum erythrorhizon TaxID=34254 RepID=A0AAV3QIA8_LITER
MDFAHANNASTAIVWLSFNILTATEEDLKNGVHGAVPIPPHDVRKEDVIEGLVTNVKAMIKADRKITALNNFK